MVLGGEQLYTLMYDLFPDFAHKNKGKIMFNNYLSKLRWLVVDIYQTIHRTKTMIFNSFIPVNDYNFRTQMTDFGWR